MGQQFVQFDHDPDCITIAGAAATTSIQLARDIVVHYNGGASDTIAAGTVAAVPGGPPHLFDRSKDVWVVYTVPGSGTLSATQESQLAGIAGDYAPLVRILRHSWDWFQPMQPGGTSAPSGAWSGGASVGVGRAITGGGTVGNFTSQSITGGGSVS